MKKQNMKNHIILRVLSKICSGVVQNYHFNCTRITVGQWRYFPETCIIDVDCITSADLVTLFHQSSRLRNWSIIKKNSVDNKTRSITKTMSISETRSITKTISISETWSITKTMSISETRSITKTISISETWSIKNLGQLKNSQSREHVKIFFVSM